MTEPNPCKVEVLVENLEDTVAFLLKGETHDFDSDPFIAEPQDVARALLFHAHTLAAQHGFALELMAAHEALLEETEGE